jgi:hypothetical protein
VSKPEFPKKCSSTPTTEISGSVFWDSNFTSALEVAVNEREVSVNGYW